MTSTKKTAPRKLWMFLVLVLGAGAVAVLLNTAPKTVPEEKTSSAKIVQTLALTPSTQSIVVTADGTVMPTRQVTIRPEVSGRVLRHHPSLVPGGHVAAGEEIVGIDRADYELALQEHQSALQEAKFGVSVEEGRQVVAKREFGLLQKDLDDDDVNRSLVLREPHLKRAEALLTKAKNEIAKAQLDLARTSITAPFDAVVIEESVEIGQLIEPGDTICSLAGTGAFWVRVTLQFDQLQWIRLPADGEPGSRATVYLDTGNGVPVSWEGEVERLLGDLDPNTRMARAVVRVDDPLDRAASNANSGDDDGKRRLPLLIGMFARVDIDAGTLRDVLSIPRAALRGGNKIWVVDSSSALQIRETEVLWNQEKSFLIKNTLKEGEDLIVSDLRVALPGMKVKPQPGPTEDSGENRPPTQPSGR